MKIGIFTFHIVSNYGASFQAFALRRYLSDISADNEVYICDHRCVGNDDIYYPEYRLKNGFASKSPIKNVILKTVMKPAYCLFEKKKQQRKYNGFLQFRENYYNMAPDITDKNDYDALFFGSDQIWNPNITKGFDKAFFGVLPNSENARKISYAASCGNTENVEGNEEFTELLGNLDRISVRESALKDYLKSKNIDCKTVVDPTLLLEKEDYVRHFELEKKENKHYILVYELNREPRIDKIAEEIKKKKGCRIVKVCGYDPYIPKPHDITDASPKEFLQLLYNADYVVTNSFHGTALSIVFEKDFCTLIHKSRSSRIVNLLNVAGLNCDDTDCKKFENIDYSCVKANLIPFIQSSKEFIADALKG